jgi:hypothetical protein
VVKIITVKNVAEDNCLLSVELYVAIQNWILRVEKMSRMLVTPKNVEKQTFSSSTNLLG